ncbi:U32 family peptidase [Escherichia coli]
MAYSGSVLHFSCANRAMPNRGDCSQACRLPYTLKTIRGG